MLPEWDLGELYDGPNDPRIEGDLSRAEREAAEFRGSVARYEQIAELAAKPKIFAQLRAAEDAADPERAELFERLTSRAAQVMQLLDAKLDPSTATERHRNWVAARAPLEDRGRGALVARYHRLLSSHRFAFGSLMETQTTLAHADRAVRASGAAALARGYAELAPSLAPILAGCVADQRSASARERQNQLEPGVIDSVFAALEAREELAPRYYRAKAKILGLEVLEEHDRSAPIPGLPARWTLPEARALILEGFAEFSPKYSELAAQFFDRRWIDFRERPAKSPGGWCEPVTSDVHPYVLVHFDGTLKSVLVLAHELGHAIHGELMRPAGFLNFQVPAVLAETASLLAEHLVFRRLHARSPSAALRAAELEQLLHTTYRQLAFVRFERALYREAVLDAARIGELFLAEQARLYQGTVRFAPGSEHAWCAIGPIFSEPFYLSSYPFGQLLALAIAESAPPDAVLEMFAAGATKRPAELMLFLGIDLGDAATWARGVRVIEQRIRELEAEI